ncbi:MAG TPA: aminoacyl-tRNA hydrolase, partial [candidate division Zixibacteria bacterium]|nr:aminoacyl-tRNA hydrolase [candidate division Zixibacteria bacterium]
MISLVVGLGNIGRRYAGTRHNLGFEVLDRAAAALGAPRATRTGLDERTVCRRGDRTIVLAWPRTYMNRSGDAVAALLQDYGLRPAEVLVVVDDFNLPLGRVRLRTGGSDGGHNGLASIIATLETQRFPRLR